MKILLRKIDDFLFMGEGTVLDRILYYGSIAFMLVATILGLLIIYLNGGN